MEIKNKNILITGASGLVGIPTVEKCLQQGANTVIAVDIRRSPQLDKLSETYSNLKFLQVDLTNFENCKKLFDQQIDIVLHIAGVKGSPIKAATEPANYLFPMLMFNTNMIKASFDANVKWFVYLSSVGVYQPSELMVEDDVWNTMPSKNDWYPGWTKRMGELAIESLQIQYGWNNWTIIRPANIYGKYDNFSPNGTVISSNIWKIFNLDDPNMICWGNGTARRDFVFGDDVAQAAIDVVKQEVNDIINFGCGEAVSIKDTIETIVSIYKEQTGKDKNIIWDESKPNGDLLRCLSSNKQKKYNILPTTSLKDGLNNTMKAYQETR